MKQIVYDLKLTTMVLILKMWRHYLYGVYFYIFSDHM